MGEHAFDASVADRLAAVRQCMASAARRAGRSENEITLVGVTKRQAVERIAAAVRAGVTTLGENYVQEMRSKQPLLAQLLSPEQVARIRWRMIGRLQRNKARPAAELFDAVETLDRSALAVELDKRAGAAGRVLEVLIQVNLSGEPQKGGVEGSELPELLSACHSLHHLRVTGLMVIPAAVDDPETNRPVFAQLRELRDTLRGQPGGGDLHELSMGMSGDYEIAIEEGATLVRVGTALFGTREEKP
jgi:pyridoxal phosphate enzyme (YggS family)